MVTSIGLMVVQPCLFSFDHAHRASSYPIELQHQSGLSSFSCSWSVSHTGLETELICWLWVWVGSLVLYLFVWVGYADIDRETRNTRHN